MKKPKKNHSTPRKAREALEPKAEQYKYVRAIVSGDGSLSWEYQVEGNPTRGSMTHDEDVSEWSEEDIRKLTRQMLDVKEDCEIEVQYD